MKNYKKKIALLIALSMIVSGVALTNPTSASATKRTVYYDFKMSKWDSKRDKNIPYKFTLKKNVLTANAPYVKASKEDALWNKNYKKKKKTFMISKKVKYYIRGGEGSSRISRSDFKSILKSGEGMILKVVNGKVVKVIYHS